jgi:hypothetical protein
MVLLFLTLKGFSDLHYALLMSFLISPTFVLEEVCFFEGSAFCCALAS